MTAELGLKFKRTKTLANSANSVCCLYQRQQFALNLIHAMVAGKRIINIDEASLGQSSFLRQAWGFKGEAIRHMTRPLGHRLSIFAGVDTFGKVILPLVRQIQTGETLADSFTDCQAN